MIVALVLASLVATGAEPRALDARWHRTFERPAAPQTFAPTVAGDVVLAHLGTRLVALDARTGATRWTLPNVAGYVAGRDVVVIEREGIVFAVRSSDSGMLWKRRCDATYAAIVGARTAMLCGFDSTVVATRDGRVLARARVKDFAHEVPSTTLRIVEAPRVLDGRFALVAISFDGAWMGDEFVILDTATGGYRRLETDLDVVDVADGTIAYAPQSSMLPYDLSGVVTRRSLRDGRLVGRARYDPEPNGDDGNARNRVTFARHAVYVETPSGKLYRFARRETSGAVVVGAVGFDNGPRVSDVVPLGDAAFVASGMAVPPVGPRAPLRSVDVEFTSDAGTVRRTLTTTPFRLTDGSGAPTALSRVGDRVAVDAGPYVRLYDARGDERERLAIRCEANVSLAPATGGYVAWCDESAARVGVYGYAT